MALIRCGANISKQLSNITGQGGNSNTTTVSVTDDGYVIPLIQGDFGSNMSITLNGVEQKDTAPYVLTSEFGTSFRQYLIPVKAGDTVVITTGGAWTVSAVVLS